MVGTKSEYPVDYLINVMIKQILIKIYFVCLFLGHKSTKRLTYCRVDKVARCNPIMLPEGGCSGDHTSLGLIFQACLHHNAAVVPGNWKMALITPIFKKDNISSPANNGDIFLTAVCCKWWNIIITHSHVMQHLEDKMKENWLMLFSYTSTKLLSLKLHHYGIHGKTLHWIVIVLYRRLSPTYSLSVSLNWQHALEYRRIACNHQSYTYMYTKLEINITHTMSVTT